MYTIRSLKGLNWQVFNKYVIKNINGKDYIIPVFENGIKKTYNPNIDDSKKFSNERQSLFIDFAKTDITDENILKIIHEYGLLWTNREKAGLIKGDLLGAIRDEIIALKKALEIYLVLKIFDSNKLSKLIKFKKASEYFDNFFKIYKGKLWEKDDIKTNEKFRLQSCPNSSFIISTGLKKEPTLEFTIEENKEKDPKVIIQIAYQYLMELITDRIKRNGGALPYYSKIWENLHNPLGFSILSSLECSNLAAALWIQFYNVIASGQQIMECLNCGRPFLREHKKLYCGPTCKNTKNKRDSRQRIAKRLKK